jgi:hypothetical protein
VNILLVVKLQWIVNPHLKDYPDAIIAFPDETFD